MADYGDDTTWTNKKKRSKWLPLYIGLAGAFGGVGPNLLRIGAELQRGEPMPNWTYFIGVTIFAVMGGSIALFYKETRFDKAIALGMSLPALFQSGAGDLSAKTAEASMLTPPGISIPMEEPKRNLALVQRGAHPVITVVFLSEDGKRREEHRMEAHDEENVGEVQKRGFEYVVIAIPDFASNAFLIYGRSKSDPIGLTAEESQVFAIVAEKNILSGIQRAIGLDSVDEWVVTLEKVKEGSVK